MKKLKLNLSNVKGAEVLTREQLKRIMGGSRYSCQCNGTGTWTGSYNNAQDVVDAINNYCADGGTCTAA